MSIVIQEEVIEWENIQILDFTDIRILEQIYIPKAKATTLIELSILLKKYKINKMKILRRLRRLEKLKVIKIIKNTKPLCIWGLPEIEQRIQKKILNTKRWLGIE